MATTPVDQTGAAAGGAMPKKPRRANTPEQLRAVNQCWDWFDKDRTAKQFYLDEMTELDKVYNSSHWDLVGPNGTRLRSDLEQETRPNAVENITWSLVEGLVAEFARDLELVDFPTEQGDEGAALLMTDLKQFINYKNRVEVERQKWNRYLFLYGTAIWEVV